MAKGVEGLKYGKVKSKSRVVKSGQEGQGLEQIKEDVGAQTPHEICSTKMNAAQYRGKPRIRGRR